MSAHWLFINSPAYRRFIERSRDNKWLFWGATAGLFGVAVIAADAIMGMTNPNMAEEGAKSKADELAKLPMHAQIAARQQREQLSAMLRDVTSGNDGARYRSMLDGKIHGTTHGTSMPSAPIDDRRR